MDVEWALSELRGFIELTTLRQPASGGGIVYMGDFASPVGRSSDIIAAAQVVEKILDRVIPRWRTEVPDDGKKRWARHRQAAIRAVTELERQAEIAERLGDNAPTISAGGLHPWVWEAARSLWQSGHYREAVRVATVKINAETQNKVARRNISETDLFKQAYSDRDRRSGPGPRSVADPVTPMTASGASPVTRVRCERPSPPIVDVTHLHRRIGAGHPTVEDEPPEGRANDPCDPHAECPRHPRHCPLHQTLAGTCAVDVEVAIACGVRIPAWKAHAKRTSALKPWRSASSVMP